MIDRSFLSAAGCTPEQITTILHARKVELDFMASCSAAGLFPAIARRAVDSDTDDLQKMENMTRGQQVEIIRATWPDFIKKS